MDTRQIRFIDKYVLLTISHFVFDDLFICKKTHVEDEMHKDIMCEMKYVKI